MCGIGVRRDYAAHFGNYLKVVNHNILCQVSYDTHTRLAVNLHIAEGNILTLLDHDGGTVVSAVTKHEVVANGRCALRLETDLSGSCKLFLRCPACVESVADRIEEVETACNLLVDEAVTLCVELGIEPLLVAFCYATDG